LGARPCLSIADFFPAAMTGVRSLLGRALAAQMQGGSRSLIRAPWLEE
jgi:hypothetical protein